MKKYWFRPKRLGWGFTPTTWEGWVATIIFIVLLLLSAQINNVLNGNSSEKDGLRYFLDVIILSSIFTALFKDKVEGGLRWRFWK